MAYTSIHGEAHKVGGPKVSFWVIFLQSSALRRNRRR